VETHGIAYVVGNAGAGFPQKVGPTTALNGAFITKVNAAGTDFDYSGVIPGTARGAAVAVDTNGSAYITGTAFSGLPVKVGPSLVTPVVAPASFVAKVHPSGSNFIYCGYFGGNYGAEARAIAVDALGRAYIAGNTGSTNLPVAVGPDLTFNGPAGMPEGFVARVRADGTGLEYCGYLGGADVDEINAIAVDPEGNACVAGRTWSTESSFPVRAGPDLTYNVGSFIGAYDAFVARISFTPCGGCAVTLTVAGLVRTNGTQRVSLAFVPCGCDHYVEYVNALDGSPWQTLPGAPHNTGAVTDTNTASLRFYRVRMQ
jgi:hypothetical protein